MRDRVQIAIATEKSAWAIVFQFGLNLESCKVVAHISLVLAVQLCPMREGGSIDCRGVWECRVQLSFCMAVSDRG